MPRRRASREIFPSWKLANASHAERTLPQWFLYGLSEILPASLAICFLPGGMPNSRQEFSKFTISCSGEYCLSLPPETPTRAKAFFHVPNLSMIVGECGLLPPRPSYCIVVKYLLPAASAATCDASTSSASLRRCRFLLISNANLSLIAFIPARRSLPAPRRTAKDPLGPRVDARGVSPHIGYREPSALRCVNRCSKSEVTRQCSFQPIALDLQVANGGRPFVHGPRLPISEFIGLHVREAAEPLRRASDGSSACIAGWGWIVPLVHGYSRHLTIPYRHADGLPI